MTREALRDALKQPSPCDGCQHAQRCRVQRLACDAFVLFAAGGSRERWQIAPRQPSAEKYRKAAA